MSFQEFPKWIESADSTPENRKGTVVQDAAEEKALLEKMTKPEPKDSGKGQVISDKLATRH